MPWTPGQSGNPLGRPADPAGRALRALERQASNLDALFRRHAAASLLLGADPTDPGTVEDIQASVARELKHIERAISRLREAVPDKPRRHRSKRHRQAHRDREMAWDELQRWLELAGADERIEN